MTKFTKFFSIGLMLLSSSAAFASPLHENIVTDGVLSGIALQTPSSLEFPAEDQPAFLGAMTDNSTGDILLASDMSDRISISAPMKAASTPEPPSLMLLGTSLIGAAGMVLRKRRSMA